MVSKSPLTLIFIVILLLVVALVFAGLKKTRGGCEYVRLDSLESYNSSVLWNLESYDEKNPIDLLDYYLIKYEDITFSEIIAVKLANDPDIERFIILGLHHSINIPKINVIINGETVYLKYRVKFDLLPLLIFKACKNNLDKYFIVVDVLKRKGYLESSSLTDLYITGEKYSTAAALDYDGMVNEWVAYHGDYKNNAEFKKILDEARAEYDSYFTK